MMSRSLSARSKFAAGVLLILALAAFVVAVPASAKKKSSSKSKGHATKFEKYDKRKAKQEIQLLKKMIDQRQAAINLALIGDLGIPAADPAAPPPAPDTVTSATIKIYCQAYALRMQTEQAQLLIWLKDWHKIAYTPKHQAPAASDDEDEDTLLDLTGNEFVAALLDEMIGVHMRGVAFEKQCDKKGYHPELRDFAKAAIKLDLAEVAQIKAWIKIFEADDDDDDDDENDD